MSSLCGLLVRRPRLHHLSRHAVYIGVVVSTVGSLDEAYAARMTDECMRTRFLRSS